MKWDIHNLKKRFGYGSLREESKIVDDLSSAVKPRGFDHVVSSVVTDLLLQAIIPWIDYCFRKYTEEQFHQRMSQGFDFIQDWKDNHPDRYRYILKAIRTIRRKIDTLDNERILVVVLHEINRRGWTVTEWEKGRFRTNIDQLIAEIYS